MKRILIIFILISCSSSIYAQTDTTLTQFLELVDKVQADKKLSGTFIYKGYKAEISEYKEYKTAIGKFIQIKWPYTDDQTFPKFMVIFHNSLGYMTRSVFNSYKQVFKDYKAEKNKYIKGNYCVELKNDKKLPYILHHFITDGEIKEIK